MKQILYYLTIILVPLVPAVVLWWFFGTENGAKYVNEVQGIELGGPIAAYFIVMIVGSKIFKGLFGIEDPEVAEITRNYRENENLCEELEGRWSFEAIVRSDPDENPFHIHGAANIRRSRYRLRMDGNWLDEENNQVARWDAKQVFLDDQELIYLFQAPDLEKPGVMINGLGRVAIHRNQENEILELKGSWNVLGQPAMGAVTFHRDAKE